MIKILFIILILLTPNLSFGHVEHYKDIKKIEMNVFKDGKLIGFCNYEFFRKKNKTKVENLTEFQVKLLGIEIFTIKSKSIEVYENNQLLSFNSKTLQNKKKKFVNLKYIKKENNYLIDGSSYQGSAENNNIIGSWWNHKILSANKQISPLSGSIKNQVVSFIKKENIIINGKNYLTHKFSLRSKNLSLPDDKKLDFEIWLEPEKNIILKVSYKRLGYWEYILNNIITN